MPETILRKLLVRCPNWVGDIVMATPALHALRDRFPEAEVHALVPGHARPILAGSTAVDQVHGIDPSAGRGIRRIFAMGRMLRPQGFDAAILLTNSFGTALEALLARIPARIGYAGDGRSLLLTRRISRRRHEPRPMVESYLDIVRTLGCESRDLRYRLAVTGEERAAVDVWMASRGLDDGRAVVALNPGASFGSSKLWLSRRFAEVGDRIAGDYGAHVVLLGGPGEDGILAEISGYMKAPHVNSLEDGRGVDLGELKALVERLALLVTTDTGPRSYGQAFGVPTVVVMGSTHPGWTDANMESSVVVRHDVECGPCHRKVCPLEHHECMTLVRTDEVMDAVSSLWPE